jgi:OOP family OmpA-OmpF porin
MNVKATSLLLSTFMILAGILLPWANSYSQQPVHYSSLQDGYSQWQSTNSRKLSIAAQNQTLVLTAQENLAFCYFQTPIDFSKDFSFRFTVLSAAMPFVLWNSSGENIATWFLYSQQQYRISQNPIGQTATILAEDHRFLIDTQKPHEVWLQQVNGTLRIYLKDTTAHTFGAPIWEGPYKPHTGAPYLGFLLYDKGERLAIRNIRISYHPLRIHQPLHAAAIRLERLHEISTGEDDLYPIVSADGQTLYFTSRPMGSAVDHIYYTVRNAGQWSKRIKMASPINEDNRTNGLISIAADNRQLYLNNYFEQGKPIQQGISRAVMQNGHWAAPQGIRLENYQNKSRSASFFITADNRYLLTGSTLDGGYGASDLWIAERKEDGTFGTFRNLGATINTSGFEGVCFLAPDNKTLYFTSTGHPGYGSYDLFMARRLDESWARWSTPLNLGPVINSMEKELCFSIDSRSDTAYMSSSRETHFDNDIYQLSLLPDSLLPEPTILVYGYAREAGSGQQLGSSAILFRSQDREEHYGDAQTDENGYYQTILPIGNAVELLAQKPGYYSLANTLPLDITSKTTTAIRLDVWLEKIEAGKTIELNRIFFKQSEATLLPSSEAEINRLYDFLLQTPSAKIELSGHTDRMGSEKKNIELSWQRAHTVRALLLRKGIAPKRIKVKGYGSARPIAPNDNEENRSKNRRVEMTILQL